VRFFEAKFRLLRRPASRHGTPPNNEPGQILPARLPWFRLFEKHPQPAGNIAYRRPVFVQGGSTTVSFAFETTLSGRVYLRHIDQWRSAGYHIFLYFLALHDVETAISRVAARVVQGGHSIPEEVIRRRFIAGLRHFEEDYKPRVNVWVEYNCSGEHPTLTEWGANP
jgi:predicted ABC-type ATPase